MKKLLFISIALLTLSACKAPAKEQEMESRYLSFLCVDNVRYIKNYVSHSYVLTPKYQSNGQIENCGGNKND